MPPKTLPSFLNTQVKLKTPVKNAADTASLKARSASPVTIATSLPVSPQKISSENSNISRSFCRRNIIIVLVVVVLVFCVIFSPFELWYNDYLSLNINTVKVDPEPFSVAQVTSNVEDGAFVFVGIA